MSGKIQGTEGEALREIISPFPKSHESLVA
jgi:hypothetical protein